MTPLSNARKLAAAVTVASLGLATSAIANTAANHALVIDRSGSMNGANIQLAKQAAEYYLDAIGHPAITDTQQAGVASYESTATIDQLLINAQQGPGHTLLSNSVQALSAGGGTNIGAGLQQGLNILTSANTNKPANTAECVLLLSDGQASEPTHLEAALSGRVDYVHTLAIGSNTNETVMSNISGYGVNDGQFRIGKTTSDIDKLDLFAGFYNMAAVCRDGETIEVGDPITLPPGSMTCMNAFVSAADFVDFEAVFIGGTPEITLEPPAPHAEDLFDETMFSQNATGDWIFEQGHDSVLTHQSNPNAKSFTLEKNHNYETGFWQFCAKNNSSSTISLFSNATTFGDDITIKTTRSQANLDGCNDEAVITTSVAYTGLPVTTAVVTADIISPAGQVINTITLSDDGNSNSGDSVAFDGVYSAKVSQLAEVGNYEFKINVSHTDNGSTPTFMRKDTLTLNNISECIQGCTSANATPLGSPNNRQTFNIEGNACFSIDDSYFYWGQSSASVNISPEQGMQLEGSIALPSGSTLDTLQGWYYTSSTSANGDILFEVNTSNSRSYTIEWH